jgi:hypothetical protein
MSAKSWTMVVFAVSVLVGCPQPIEQRCTPQNCASGCCLPGGACATGAVDSACGINGAACVVCSGVTACQMNECKRAAAGGSAAGGSAAGGSAAGGSAAGGSAGGGSAADAGVTCAAVTLDPTLGTFSLRGTTTVVSSGALPAGTAAFGLRNGQLYTVTTDGQLRSLGTLPSLTLGPAIVDVRAPADRDGGIFIGGTIASNGQNLLTGYTKLGTGIPGVVALVQPEDAGVEYLSAPGNYTSVGLASGAFIVNSLGLANATGNGLFALRPGSPSQSALLTSFPQSFAGSGYTALTTAGVLVAGFSQLPSYDNVARAFPLTTYGGPVSSGSSFSYQAANAPIVAEGADFAALTSFDTDAIVVRGGYDAMYNPFTTRVDRVPLALAISGATQTVAVGTAQTLLENSPAQCTRVFAAVGAGTDLYLGLTDRQGRRLVKISP